jgi:DNA-binding HxlR family transcriptional regulator
VLTQLLGKLQACGLIKRNVWPTQPIRVEYALTTTGIELVGFLHELQAWAEAAGLAAEGR